jgi:ABC-2 type transport system permease protein
MSALLHVSLSTQRRAAIGWAIGLAAVAAMYAAFYPSIKTSAATFDNYFQSLPDAVKSVIGSDYTTPAGYLRAEFFSLLGPVLLLVYAIGAGGKSIAGEEEARSLDLLLSTPLTRAQVVRDKAATLLLTMAGLAAVVFAVVTVIGPLFDLSVPLADAGAACALFLLIGLAFGSLALAVGCATGRRAWATAVAGGAAVATYVVNALASSVPALGWTRPLSPFRWYLEPDPLTTGLHPANVAVLLGIAVVCTGAAFWTFGRRDLSS